MAKINIAIYVIFVTYAFGVCISAPVDVSKIVENVNEIDVNRYHFRYYTDYGISREETGELVPKGNKEVLVVKGRYSYRGIDGKTYKVLYEADENGYRAKVGSELLPTVFSTAALSSAALASLAGGGLG